MLTDDLHTIIHPYSYTPAHTSQAPHYKRGGTLFSAQQSRADTAICLLHNDCQVIAGTHATHEYVVPKSMPIAGACGFAMLASVTGCLWVSLLGMSLVCLQKRLSSLSDL
jgi:hypothetical protein